MKSSSIFISISLAVGIASLIAVPEIISSTDNQYPVRTMDSVYQELSQIPSDTPVLILESSKPAAQLAQPYCFGTKSPYSYNVDITCY